MNLTALFVYAPAEFSISNPIEHLVIAGGHTRTEVIPAKTNVALRPGVYRYATAVTVKPSDGAVEGADFRREAITNQKHPWPDPPLEAVLTPLGLTREQVNGFLSGTGSRVEL